MAAQLTFVPGEHVKIKYQGSKDAAPSWRNVCIESVHSGYIKVNDLGITQGNPYRTFSFGGIKDWSNIAQPSDRTAE